VLGVVCGVGVAVTCVGYIERIGRVGGECSA
jgi:hypothetical protein